MQALEREIINQNWITILFLVALSLLTLLSAIDVKKLKKSFFAIFDPVFIEEEVEENPSFFSAFNLILYFFFILILAFLLYQLSAEFSVKVASRYLEYFFVVLSYFSLKWFLEYLLKILFQFKEQVAFFHLFKNRSLYAVSMVFFGVLVLTVYLDISNFYLLFATLIVLGLRVFSIVFNNKKLILNKLFYFILYLCALEIAPLLIIFKLTF